MTTKKLWVLMMESDSEFEQFLSEKMNEMIEEDEDQEGDENV